jgi:hypothetical protein
MERKLATRKCVKVISESGIQFIIDLSSLTSLQHNKCFYCNCEMNKQNGSPQQATREHLIDKWSSPRHKKINTPCNLVAACYYCNSSRGAVRNTVARSYYKTLAIGSKMKRSIDRTSSEKLYSLFGAVPQELFIKEKHVGT